MYISIRELHCCDITDFRRVPHERAAHLNLTRKVPEKLQLYGLYVYYVVHICDFGMLKVNQNFEKA